MAIVVVQSGSAFQAGGFYRMFPREPIKRSSALPRTGDSLVLRPPIQIPVSQMDFLHLLQSLNSRVRRAGDADAVVVCNGDDHQLTIGVSWEINRRAWDMARSLGLAQQAVPVDQVTPNRFFLEALTIAANRGENRETTDAIRQSLYHTPDGSCITDQDIGRLVRLVNDVRSLQWERLDIRGCKVGRTPSYLRLLKDLLQVRLVSAATRFNTFGMLQWGTQASTGSLQYSHVDPTTGCRFSCASSNGGHTMSDVYVQASSLSNFRQWTGLAFGVQSTTSQPRIPFHVSAFSGGTRSDPSSLDANLPFLDEQYRTFLFEVS